MKDNYGSRYRFYEIIQAHKNGEDLTQFVPKNKPEEELIAKLTGGTGGSTGGSAEVPQSLLNNPNIKNVYYGMCLNGKTKFTVNVKEMFNAYCIRFFDATIEEILVGEHADVNFFLNTFIRNSQTLLDIAVVNIEHGGNVNNWSGVNTNVKQISTSFKSSGDNQTVTLGLGYSAGSGVNSLVTYQIDYNAYENADGPALLESLTNVGDVTVDFFSIFDDEVENDNGDATSYIYVLAGLCRCANLNVFDNIDWITFE